MAASTPQRKIIYSAGFVLILCALFWYFFLYEPPYSGIISHANKTHVFAHRGFGNHAPDNSLEGARMAVLEGLDGVDVDAQFSKDKEVVIFHDVSLERFTTGEGRVDSKTLAELQKFDLGEKYGRGFSGIRIRTFEDFVKEITSDAYLMVELKVAAVADTGIERRVHEVLAAHDAYERVYISSFNPIVLYRLKKLDPRIRTVFIFTDSGWDPTRVAETKEEDRVALPWYLRTEWTRVLIRELIKPDALSVHYQVKESTIDTLRNTGYPIFIWPVNEESSINFALAKKPFGIVTDEPRLGKALRDTAFSD